MLSGVRTGVAAGVGRGVTVGVGSTVKPVSETVLSGEGDGDGTDELMFLAELSFPEFPASAIQRAPPIPATAKVPAAATAAIQYGALLRRFGAGT